MSPPMIWTPSHLEHLDTALKEHRSMAPPDIYECVPPEKLEATVAAHLPPTSDYRLHPDSGAIDFFGHGDESSWLAAMETAQSVANSIDPGRSWFRWDQLQDEEEPGPSVLDELVSDIDGTHAIGPGGRIRAIRQASGVLVEAVVRPRISAISSSWRNLGEIVESVGEAVAEWPDARIRFAFGYHEASSYEEQRWLRPVFVFLVDQPHFEATRWRIAMVEPATETDELPPEAGLENAIGRCP
jgi:hypothetical protein